MRSGPTRAFQLGKSGTDKEMNQFMGLDIEAGPMTPNIHSHFIPILDK